MGSFRIHRNRQPLVGQYSRNSVYTNIQYSRTTIWRCIRILLPLINITTTQTFVICLCRLFHVDHTNIPYSVFGRQFVVLCALRSKTDVHDIRQPHLETDHSPACVAPVCAATDSKHDTYTQNTTNISGGKLQFLEHFILNFKRTFREAGSHYKLANNNTIIQLQPL